MQKNPPEISVSEVSLDSAPLRRTGSGALDMAYYTQRARDLRTQTIHDLAREFVNRLKCVFTACRNRNPGNAGHPPQSRSVMVKKS